MQSPSSLESLIPALPEDITKLAYETFQQGKSLFSLGHKNISTRLANMFVPRQTKDIKRLSSEALLKLQEKRSQLLEKDWQDARAGVYPVSVLFDNPWEDFFRYYPEIWLDLTQVWQRSQKKEYQTFAPEIDREGYPKYYLQNFHYQTDGYLSDMSANLYDLQVEIVFSGAADAMRRRILAPLKAGLQNTSQKSVKVLDIACGTGRTLRFIRATLPKASLYQCNQKQCREKRMRMCILFSPPYQTKPSSLAKKERKYCRIYYLFKSRKFGDYIINKNGLNG